MEGQTYKKSGGMGLHGGDYQIKILSLFLLEAFKKGENFRLSTENKDAGKFDDVVLKTDTTTILLQAKHKEDLKDKKSFITYEDIINSKKDEFYLCKYLKSLPAILKNFGSITSLILCTNTTFTKDKKDKIKIYIGTEEMEEDHILYFSDKKVYYTFNENSKELLLKDKTPDITDDIIDLFIEKMQLISIDDSNIDKRIEFLIREIDIYDATVDTKHAVMVLKEYIKNWLEDKRGNYIFLQHLGAFRSLHFVNELKQFDVEFNTTQLEISKLSKYTCFTIKNREIAKLHLFKLYKQLNTEKMLIVNYDETISRKEEIISAFIINEFVYLIVPLFNGEYDCLKTAIHNIAKETFDREYKKIIFLVDERDTSRELSRHFNHFVDVRKDVIEFETFSENYQNEMYSRVIRFQGKDVQLKDIVRLPALNTIIEESILLNLIYKKQIIINQRYQELKFNFYISRSVYRRSSTKVLSEENLCDMISNGNDVKTILLTDAPGVGKSTTLSNLQTMINSQFNFWIAKINLNDYTKLFKKNLTKPPAELLSLLVFDQNSKFTNFEKSLFNFHGNVILMLDAFDEVQNMYSDLILNLIKYCESLDNIRSIIITSRPHCVNNILEVTKNAVVLSLKSLSKQSQIEYLCQYWTTKLTTTKDNCQIFAKKLIEKLEMTITEAESLLKVPLHIQMIAEIFEENCQTFLVSNNSKPELIDAEFNLAGLFAMFIEKKKHIYVDQRCNAGGNAEVEYTMNEKFDKTIEELTIKALTTVFNDNQCKCFKILLKRSTEEIAISPPLTMGILQESYGVVKFIHHSFAEYIAARYICDYLFRDEDVLNFFFSEVCCKLKYYMLLSFINGIFDSVQTGDRIPLDTKKVAEIFEDDCLTFVFNNVIPQCTEKLMIPELRNNVIITNRKYYYNSDLCRVFYNGEGATGMNMIAESESVIEKLMVNFNFVANKNLEILQKRDMEEIALNFTRTMDILHKSDGVRDFVLDSLAEYLAARHICNCWSKNDHFLRIHFQEIYYSRWSYKLMSFLGKSTLKF